MLYDKFSAQRDLILSALRLGPLTTTEAIQNLGVIRPAARVMELREDGHNIVTTWRVSRMNGRPHRVASYVLLASQ